MNAKIILVLMIAVLLYSCGRSGSEVPNDVIKPVKIAEVVSGSMVTKTYAGVVDAQETTDLAFTVNGQILEMNVDEGQVVIKGQLIVGLDTRDLIDRKSVV